MVLPSLLTNKENAKQVSDIKKNIVPNVLDNDINKLGYFVININIVDIGIYWIDNSIFDMDDDDDDDGDDNKAFDNDNDDEEEGIDKDTEVLDTFSDTFSDTVSDTIVLFDIYK